MNSEKNSGYLYPVYATFYPQEPVTYFGNIISAYVLKVSRTEFVVSGLVLYKDNVFHRFTINSLKVGLSLYNYINSDRRVDRMLSVDFELSVEPTTQKVVAYRAIDHKELAPDVFERSENIRDSVKSGLPW